MKVKKYVAPTMPEVMQQIRKELGPDAVILNSKEIKQGRFLGLLKKRKIEVVAALDPQPIKPKQEKTVTPLVKETASTAKSGKTDHEVLQEIQQLKKMIELQSAQTKTNFSPEYQVVYQHLLDQEVTEMLAIDLLDKIVEQHNDNGVTPAIEQIFRDTKQEINRRLHDLSFTGVTYDKQIIHFVGPTGVGKTTTLAKVAASCMLNDHKKVAFITADTYRIAAIEQLKTYARILDVPIEVAYNNDDYKAAINQFSDYDLILVDTAGRNFRDKQYVEELKKSINFDQNVETYLVLSLTAKPKDILDIYEQFQHIPIKELIFTKLDETRQYGSMLNVMINKQIGIAYLTNGQGVPDDLTKPSANIVSNLIVGENGEA
ncbi:flagellar biosynthesis protein FlhF [Virgibacillus sp. FSP13]